MTMVKLLRSIPGSSRNQPGMKNTVVSSSETETVEVFVEHDEECQAQCDEERQSNEAVTKETKPEKRDEDTSVVASTLEELSSSPYVSSTGDKNRSLHSRRNRIRGNRRILQQFAPLRRRVGLASPTASADKATVENETTTNRNVKETPKEEAEPLPPVVPIEKKPTTCSEARSTATSSETSFSSVFGKKYMALRQQSLDRRLLALERHLEQVSLDEGDEECNCDDTQTKSKASSEIENIKSNKKKSKKKIVNVNRLAAIKQQQESFENDSARDESPLDPLSSWLSDHEPESESSYDSDEASHDTFHSFMVNSLSGSKFGSGTFTDDDETNADGERGTFSFDSDDDTHGSHTTGTYTDGGERTDGSFTDDEGGETILRSLTDLIGLSTRSYADGRERTDMSADEEGEETIYGSLNDIISEGDENDGTETADPSTIHALSQASLSSDADPFSEILVSMDDEKEEKEEEVCSGDDGSIDLFQYKEGRFLLVI